MARRQKHMVHMVHTLTGSRLRGCTHVVDQSNEPGAESPKQHKAKLTTEVSEQVALQPNLPPAHVQI